MKQETSDTTQTQRIIRDYYEPLYTKKLDSLEEMDPRNIQRTKTES